MTNEEFSHWWHNERQPWVDYDDNEEKRAAWKAVCGELTGQPGREDWPSIWDIPVEKRGAFKAAYILIFG